MEESATMADNKDCWYVPLMERFTQVSRMGSKEKYIEVDGIGLSVRYDDEKDLAPENIRKHLIGSRETFALIDASSMEEVIQIFNSEWDGAKIGTKSKALRIANMNLITKYPSCAKRHKIADGEYSCGDIEDDGSGCKQGTNGMCVISGYDIPGPFCPLAEKVV
jgi:hypothetical protein